MRGQCAEPGALWGEANKSMSWGKGNGQEGRSYPAGANTYLENPCSDAELPGEAVCVWSWAETEGLPL